MRQPRLIPTKSGEGGVSHNPSSAMFASVRAKRDARADEPNEGFGPRPFGKMSELLNLAGTA